MKIPLRLLLVEDDAVFRDLILRRLKSAAAGHVDLRVDPASSIAEARASLPTGGYDAIVLDLGLPDSHGLQTVEEMLRTTSMPIVVLSGDDELDLALAAVGQGADDFLSKESEDGRRLLRTVLFALMRRGRRAAQDDPEWSRLSRTLLAND